MIHLHYLNNVTERWLFAFTAHSLTKENSDMTSPHKTLRMCPKGHRFHKSTDCPTCPICEAENKPASGFLSELGSPARNALIHKGITTLTELATYSEREILAFHGMGPRSIPTLRNALLTVGLSFKDAQDGEG